MPLQNRGTKRQFECSCLDHYQSYVQRGNGYEDKMRHGYGDKMQNGTDMGI